MTDEERLVLRFNLHTHSGVLNEETITQIATAGAEAVRPLCRAVMKNQVQPLYALMALGVMDRDMLVREFAAMGSEALPVLERLLRVRAWVSLPVYQANHVDRYPGEHFFEAARGALQAIWESLGNIGGAEAVRILCTELRFRVPHVVTEPQRAQIAGALVQIGGESVAPLIALLGHKDPDVRRWSAFVLGRIGDTRALEPLCLSVIDPDRGVRQTAARSLGAMGWSPHSLAEEVPYLLATDNRTRLAQLDGDAVAPLCSLVELSASSLRTEAAEALGWLRQREALPTLRRRLRPLIGETHRETRTAVAAAIRQIEAASSDTRNRPRAGSTAAAQPEGRPRHTDTIPDADGRPR